MLLLFSDFASHVGFPDPQFCVAHVLLMHMHADS